MRIDVPHKTRIEAPADKVKLLRDLQHEKQGTQEWTPYPHQVIPDGDWFFWLMQAGRGAGKTATASHYVSEHIAGPPCMSGNLPHRVALIAPTLGDAIESAHLNDMALTRIDRRARFTQSGGGSMVKYPDGSQVRLFGTHTKDDVERLRAGGNRCLVWAEEIAVWRYLADAWENMMLGLRIGPHPRIVGTTTPKARPEYIVVKEQADVISNASIMDNPSLNADQKQRLLDLYDGTSLGEQELHGKLIEEAEGALWQSVMIDVDRMDPDVLDPGDDDDDVAELLLGRTVVAVDPPGGATEAGIVAAALLPSCRCGGARLPHFAVLEDASGKLSPEGWGSRAVGTLEEWTGDRIVGEINFGGDMVESIIRHQDPGVSYKNVRASRGKRVRAEPIKALYEQHRVHHIGYHPLLESEMVQWVPDESAWSPNRLDALVWALTDLSGGRLLDGDLMV